MHTNRQENYDPAHSIEARGVSTGILEGVDVSIPHGRLTVLCGPSGSGKTTLAVGTIWAEAARRAGIALRLMSPGAVGLQPEFDEISGLLPAVDLTEFGRQMVHANQAGRMLGVADLLLSAAAQNGELSCGRPGCALQAADASAVYDQMRSASAGSGNAGESGPLLIEACLLEPSWEFGPAQPDKFNPSLEEASARILELQEAGYRRFAAGSSLTRLPPIFSESPGQDISAARQQFFEDVAAAAAEGLGIYLVFETLEPSSLEKARFCEAVAAAIRLSTGIVRVRRSGADSQAVWFAAGGLFCRKCGRRTPAALRPGPRFLEEEIDDSSFFYSLAGRKLSALWKCSASELLSHADVISGALPAAGAELKKRLNILAELGLERTTMDTPLRVLSPGERLRAAAAFHLALGAAETLFVADEPSRLLHPEDLRRFHSALYALVDLGNTCLVVEKEGKLLPSAAWMIRLEKKGRACAVVSCQGVPPAGLCPGEQVLPVDRETKDAAPAAPCAGQTGKKREFGAGKELEIFPCAGILEFQGQLLLPPGSMTAVIGRSGAGKTRFLRTGLLEGGCLRQTKRGGRSGRRRAFYFEDFGSDAKRLVWDIGGLADPIAALYAGLPESRRNGLLPQSFRLSGQGGCVRCKGAGVLKIDLGFLGTAVEPCPLCRGRRFRPDLERVQFKGCSISGVLELSIDEAVSVFDAQPEIVKQLYMLRALGLGALVLGMQAGALPHSMRQRLLLAQAGPGAARQDALLLLEQPLEGLDKHDLEAAVARLRGLASAGGCVIYTTHDCAAVSLSDFVLEIGAPGILKFFGISPDLPLDHFRE